VRKRPRLKRTGVRIGKNSWKKGGSKVDHGRGGFSDVRIKEEVPSYYGYAGKKIDSKRGKL